MTAWAQDPLDPSTWMLGKFVVHNVHSATRCAGQVCTVHNPTEHHMREWPVGWVDGVGVMRLCPHDRPHPDPDSLRAILMPYAHGCDGCCEPPS